jgi:hypothetical protein
MKTERYVLKTRGFKMAGYFPRTREFGRAFEEVYTRQLCACVKHPFEFEEVPFLKKEQKTFAFSAAKKGVSLRESQEQQKVFSSFL